MPTGSLPRVVLHQCNIAEFHSHAVIYRGAKGEGNVINLMRFRRNITFLVYLPHSIAAVKKFSGQFIDIPLAGRAAVCQLLLEFFFWITASAACGDMKKGDGLRPCSCGTAL